MRDISNKEAIEMMLRCKEEILIQRATIDRLKPKADAYDNIASVLRLLPQQSVGMGENLIWTLDKRIQELKEEPSNSTPAAGNSSGVTVLSPNS